MSACVCGACFHCWYPFVGLHVAVILLFSFLFNTPAYDQPRIYVSIQCLMDLEVASRFPVMTNYADRKIFSRCVWLHVPALVGMHLAVGLLGYRAHIEFSSPSVPVDSRSRSLLTGSCCSVSSTNIQCPSFSSNHLGGCAVLGRDLVTLLWPIMSSNTFSCVLAIRISFVDVPVFLWVECPVLVDL